MKVRFWGVRGSIASPGADTFKYGGNTSCIEIVGENDDVLIIDSGTGIRELGSYILLKNTEEHLLKKQINLHILITHTHWDHIQGFPFFLPLYFSQFNVFVWGPANLIGTSLKDIISGQMIYSYFPVRTTELPAQLSFHELKEEKRYINNFYVETIYLNHPITCLGYKISYKGKIIVTLYDNEPYYNVFKRDIIASNENVNKDLNLFFIKNKKEVDYFIYEQNQKFYNFVRDADMLICDAQYTDKEYPNKIGWGHSNISFCIDLAKRSNVKKLALFHHDPMRKDAELDLMQSQIIDNLEKNNEKLVAFFCKEKVSVDV